jgi:hypothetical protein
VRTPCLAAALLAFAAAAANASTTHLRWNACYGDGGVENRFFACDTNTGSEQLVMSFTLDVAVTGVYQLDAIVRLSFAGTTLPAWWQFRTPGSCRSASLAFSPAPPAGASACIDWADGTRDGLLVYRNAGFGTNTTEIEVMSPTVATSPFDLVAGQEYFAFTAIINHQKTVGTGACAGCGDGACMGFVAAKLIRSVAGPGMPTPGGDVTIGPTTPAGQVVTWQGGAGIAIPNYGGAGFTYCPGATPARNHTWGAVKEMYR